MCPFRLITSSTGLSRSNKYGKLPQFSVAMASSILSYDSFKYIYILFYIIYIIINIYIVEMLSLFVNLKT